MITKSKAEELGVMEQDMECVGIHELLDWQIIQYRQSIDEYRKELSREQHRCVSWQEAEEEFSKMNLRSMGEQSRVEYCGLVCPSRSNCLLAMQFLNARYTEPMHKAG
jgi:hypothetical protein